MSGNVVKSQLDEATLTAIAQAYCTERCIRSGAIKRGPEPARRRGREILQQWR